MPRHRHPPGGAANRPKKAAVRGELQYLFAARKNARDTDRVSSANGLQPPDPSRLEMRSFAASCAIEPKIRDAKPARTISYLYNDTAAGFCLKILLQHRPVRTSVIFCAAALWSRRLLFLLHTSRPSDTASLPSTVMRGNGLGRVVENPLP